MGASTPKSRPAGTFLEKLEDKLIKKQDSQLVDAKGGSKEIIHPVEVIIVAINDSYLSY